jgi:hypothetical protein
VRVSAARRFEGTSGRDITPVAPQKRAIGSARRLVASTTMKVRQRVLPVRAAAGSYTFVCAASRRAAARRPAWAAPAAVVDRRDDWRPPSLQSPTQARAEAEQGLVGGHDADRAQSIPMASSPRLSAARRPVQSLAQRPGRINGPGASVRQLADPGGGMS